MLSLTSDEKIEYKKVISGISYSRVETNYVLGVIRRFKLAYRMDEDTEFIPMLCDRNESSLISQYIDISSALETHFLYTYLPNNVIHRLMVDMRSDLELDCVWLTGAVFICDNLESKALVKIEDNLLKVFVNSNSHLYPSSYYAASLRNSIRNINESLGLTAEEVIIYKASGETDQFNYALLTESYKYGNTTIYSSAFKRNLQISDILSQTDGQLESRNCAILEAVTNACLALQQNKLYWAASEDERNTYIRDILRAQSIFCTTNSLV